MLWLIIGNLESETFDPKPTNYKIELIFIIQNKNCNSCINAMINALSNTFKDVIQMINYDEQKGMISVIFSNYSYPTMKCIYDVNAAVAKYKGNISEISWNDLELILNLYFSNQMPKCISETVDYVKQNVGDTIWNSFKNHIIIKVLK